MRLNFKQTSKLLLQILKLANFVLIAVCSIGFLGTYISPIYFNKLYVITLGLHYLLLGEITFLIFWTFKKNLIFILLNLTVLISNILNIQKTIQIQFSKNEKAENSISILTLNLGGINFTNDKISEFSSFCNAHKSDIYCFQEFWGKETKTSDRTKIIAQKLNTPYHFYFHHPANIAGLAIYSKYPILDTKSIYVEPGPINGAFETKILVKNDTVSIITFHLASYRLTNNQQLNENKTFKQLEDAWKIQLIQTEKIISSVQKNKNYPTIACGDLNNTPYSYVYRELSKQLNDAFTEVGSGFSYTIQKKIFHMRIDYIFTNTKILPSDYNTFDNNFTDHKAARVVFSLQ